MAWILNWTERPEDRPRSGARDDGNEDQAKRVNVAEALVNQWGQVGIKVNSAR